MANVLATQYLVDEVAKLKAAVPSSAALVSARITNPAAALAGSNINFAVAAAGRYINPVSGGVPVLVNSSNQAFILPAEHTYRVSLRYVLATTGVAPVTGWVNVLHYDSAGVLVSTTPNPVVPASATATAASGEVNVDIVVGATTAQVAIQVVNTGNIIGLAPGSFLTIDRIA